MQRTNLELDSYKEKIKENQEKIKLNKQLPYLVGNIVEVANFRFSVPFDSAIPFIMNQVFGHPRYLIAENEQLHLLGIFCSLS